MLTASAAAARAVRACDLDNVVTRADLIRSGCTYSQIAARVAAGRWQPVGQAIVLHNGPLTRRQRWRVALLNCGPRSVLTAFTALEALDLGGWERDTVHVLAPAGTARPAVRDLRLHRTALLAVDEVLAARRCHRAAPAAVLAASTFRSARPAVGLLAATVQQWLTSAVGLRAALARATRTRHRAALLAAVDDIEMGARALGEIDFARLCRRNALPEPTRQAVRVEPSGRRRYLDAEWQLPGRRRLVAEVDGAIHLSPQGWFDDQLQQNEITLTSSVVLRFPSVVVREEEPIVVAQLRRALYGS